MNHENRFVAADERRSAPVGTASPARNMNKRAPRENETSWSECMRRPPSSGDKSSRNQRAEVEHMAHVCVALRGDSKGGRGDIKAKGLRRGEIRGAGPHSWLSRANRVPGIRSHVVTASLTFCACEA